MEQTEKFTIRFYFHTLTSTVREPGRFFSDLPPDAGLKQPLGFLLVSSLFFVVAGLSSNMPPNPIFLGGILFVNAVGMVFIAAGTGYMLMVMSMGKRVSFPLFFSIYAFSSGVTLLAAWLPFFVWFTEPWKWWLIWTGMTKGLGFRWTQAVLIIGVSIGMMILFFWSVLPVVSQKGG